MIRPLLVTIGVVALVGLGAAQPQNNNAPQLARSSPQPNVAGRFVAGEILVTFAPGANANAKADAHRLAAGIRLDEIARTGVQRISVAAGDEAAAIARYRRNPNVLYAEPNFIRTLPTVRTSPALPSQSGGSSVIPGDYHFGEQWGFHNTGQSFQCLFGNFCLYQGTPDADIDAPEAWAISTGSAIPVAVIDSGVDYTHPDLATKYLGGYDFYNGDPDPMDDHGHGTHVAGTIAAAMNNLTGAPPEEEGVVGVAPNAVIRAYKVCGVDGSCSDFAIQQAIAAAIVDGAKVINMSLGGPEFSQSTYDAVQDAWSAGLVIVAGAGNDGTTAPFYPAAYDNVISVAAFDEDHLRASYSNYGNWVDISAPGNVIMSTYRTAACGASSVPGDTSCYTWSSGTSMATPHVSGAAALVWSRSDVTSNGQVVSILLNSADPSGVSSVRLDSWTIHGGLNLHDAINYGSTRLVALAGADQTVTDSDGNGVEMVNLDGSASNDPNGSIVSYAWREGTTVIATGATPAVSFSVGVHTVTLEVTDNDGETDTDSVIVTVNPSNQVTVTASTAQATEAGPQNGVFTISRTGSTSAPLTVQYTVTGTAVGGSDYVALSGTVTINAGSSTATVTVTPINDSSYENNESVILTIAVNSAYAIGSPNSATVTIVSDDQPPDLMMSAFTVPVTAPPGGTIQVQDTTKNNGAGSAQASTTAFYFSNNSTFDASDTLVGTRPVPMLTGGATNAGSTNLTIPNSTTGTYYIIARADNGNVVTENLEGNNNLARATRIGPDLTIPSVPNPAPAGAGASVNVTDSTKNDGSVAAPSTLTGFYLSSNTVLDASDTLLTTRNVPSIAAGATNTAVTPVPIPSNTATGSYFIIVKADSGDTLLETVETNNVRAVAVKVGPDLTVSAGTVSPASAPAGGSVTINDTTKNAGGGAAGATTTKFYLSTNLAFDASDVFIGERAVPALAANAQSAASTTLTIPPGTAVGTYYLIAVADGATAVLETAETNNTRSIFFRVVAGGQP